MTSSSKNVRPVVPRPIAVAAKLEATAGDRTGDLRNAVSAVAEALELGYGENAGL